MSSGDDGLVTNNPSTEGLTSSSVAILISLKGQTALKINAIVIKCLKRNVNKFESNSVEEKQPKNGPNLSKKAQAPAQAPAQSPFHIPPSFARLCRHRILHVN